MVKTIEELNREFASAKTRLASEAKKKTKSAGMPSQKPMRAEDTILQAQRAEIPNQAAASTEEQETKNQAKNAKEMSAKKSRKGGVGKELLLLGFKIALLASSAAVVLTFLFGFARMGDPAMDPAIKDGDLVLFHRYTKAGYLPGDVIAFSIDDSVQIRRVTATAGDTVDIEDGRLVINGSPQQELGIYQNTDRYEQGVSFPLTVPSGQIFVLGDNRAGSTDSRIYGCIEIDDTLGKVMTILRRRGI
ncbi:MAG: signal peptidase I [Oscillospiraceae bacterium]|nr:signal peptidase I [Oscillospiraceae bacterium]